MVRRWSRGARRGATGSAPPLGLTTSMYFESVNVEVALYASQSGEAWAGKISGVVGLEQHFELIGQAKKGRLRSGS
jgi:hypothetical protein